MQLEQIIQRFDIKRRHSNNSYQVKCPAHEDNQASLTISQDENNKILLYCHAGCNSENILHKVGLSISDLFNNDDEKKALTEVAKYIYTDADGNPKHTSYKFHDQYGNKTFRQSHFKGNKEIWNMKDVETYLYRLPELLEDIAAERDIFIVEGEKDVDSFRALNVPATTNPMGAGKWREHFNHYFQDVNVVILPDNDAAGDKHAELVVSNLKPIARSIKIVKLPNLRAKEDVSDYIANGGTAQDIYTITSKTQSLEQAERLSATAQEIRNDNDIEKIREYIYDKDKIIHKNVIQLLKEKYHIRTSLINTKRKFFIYGNGLWDEVDKDYIGGLFMDWLYPIHATSRTVKSITDLISMTHELYVPENKWNSNPYLSNYENCAYDFENFKPIPHSPEHYFTYKNPFPFIEDATCPTFDRVILQYGLGNPKWVLRFFEMLGYAMYGKRPFQKMFWFTGTGRNGKGTLLRIIEHIVGYFRTVAGVDTRDFREKFYLARFIGKWLATAGDLHNRMANVALMKQLTGGDRQTTDIKFGDAKSFSNTALFIFAMNQMPTLPAEESIYPIIRRIEVLPFDFTIMNPDNDIEEKLLLELPGILNKGIEGLKRLLKNREFTYLERADRILKNYAKQTPAIESFVEDFIAYNPEHKGTFIGELWEHYIKFMNDLYGGDHWKTDKDITIRNKMNFAQALKHIINFKLGVDVEIERKYWAEKSGTYSLLKNIIYKTYSDVKENW
mgnify:CR=1 FL=1